MKWDNVDKRSELDSGKKMVMENAFCLYGLELEGMHLHPDSQQEPT